MKKRTPLMTVPAVLASVALLSGCVTNSETGTPEGWEPILPEADADVMALVPEDIAARGTISIGTNPPFAPFQFKDSAGNIIGVEMDLAAATASIMGLDLEIVQQEFAMILPAVDAGTWTLAPPVSLILKNVANATTSSTRSSRAFSGRSASTSPPSILTTPVA